MERSRLAVDLYQIADDSLIKEHRGDGTGWDWCWAEWERDWMDATPNRHAYRCLPLTIVNQTGWWVRNPVGFTATWRGSNAPGAIDFRFERDEKLWSAWINSQFGEGIITWNTPFLFSTKPEGSRLLICGPANYFRANVQPLMALIESDWMNMSFTMNYKVLSPDVPVRFEAGEPLFQAIPMASNICADLENADVSYRKLGDDPEMLQKYGDWSSSRRQFHEAKGRGDVKPDQWQRDYFLGRDLSGRQVAPDHRVKVKPPRVRTGPSLASAAPGNGLASCPMNGARLVATLQEEAPSNGRPVAEAEIRPAVAEVVARIEEPRQAENIPAGDAAVVSPRVDDEWRRWISENLMLGSTPESMVDAMGATGIGAEEARREIELAANSPYFRGAEHLQNRLKKREWLLAAYRRINRLNPESVAVPRRHRLSREEFLEEYYSTNRPVIITGMMDDWPAMKKWDLDFFRDRFGDREIEVQFGRNSGANYEIEREKYLKKVRMAEFVEMVRSAGTTNDFYLTANNNSSNKAVLPELWQDIIQVPEYLSGRDPMSGFFWMGPAGTITPFHHDLTNNFMAQVIGRKKVKIAPSWDMPLMDNHYHVYSRVDGRVAAPRPQARPDEAQILECILGPGEILFLPIGCLHYVEGVEISVTISFTNFLFDNDFSSFYTTYHHV